MITLSCPDLLVMVDHLPLIAILGDRSLADIRNLRLNRLKEKCLRFQFKIKYLPGPKNELYLDKFNNDNKLGDHISASFLAGVSESPMANQAVTLEEVVKAGSKNYERMALKYRIQGGFHEKLEECTLLIMP